MPDKHPPPPPTAPDPGIKLGYDLTDPWAWIAVLVQLALLLAFIGILIVFALSE